VSLELCISMTLLASRFGSIRETVKKREQLTLLPFSFKRFSFYLS
jgi:hypothetical protein